MTPVDDRERFFCLGWRNFEESKHYNSDTKQETDFSLMIETITKSGRESSERPMKKESGSPKNISEMSEIQFLGGVMFFLTGHNIPGDC